MIVARTPLRVSLLGGGSDLPDYYRFHDGRVLSFSINKYVYIAVHNFFQGGFKFSYSETELVDKVSDVKHPLIREALQFLNFNKSIELASFADIPGGGSGLGSSSAFTIGILNAISCFEQHQLSREKLAQIACHIEIEKCKSPIGKQDQYAAAIGGMNIITFRTDDSVEIKPVTSTLALQEFISQHFLLVHSGKARSANEMLAIQQSTLRANSQIEKLYWESIQLIPSLSEALERCDISDVAEIVSAGWKLKRQYSPKVSNIELDGLMELCMSRGALGGKLLGAGGGGFLLICVHAEDKNRFLRMNDLRVLEIELDTKGSSIVLNDHAEERLAN